MYKPENSYAQVRLFARRTEDKKFQQVVCVNYTLEDFIDLLDIMNSVFEKVIANKPNCRVLQKVIAPSYSLSIFRLFESGGVGTLEITETSF